MLKLTDEQKAVLKRAVKKYGSQNQKIMLFEEMAELQKAVCNDLRGRQTNVEEEIADVFIMLSQMCLMYSHADIEKWVQFKIERLKERLEK